MSGQNIKITIESEESYWEDLIEAMESLVGKSSFTTSNPLMSRRIAAMTHLKTKLNNALAQSKSGIVTLSDQLSKESMTVAYQNSFIA